MKEICQGCHAPTILFNDNISKKVYVMGKICSKSSRLSSTMQNRDACKTVGRNELVKKTGLCLVSGQVSLLLKS